MEIQTGRQKEAVADLNTEIHNSTEKYIDTLTERDTGTKKRCSEGQRDKGIERKTERHRSQACRKSSHAEAETCTERHKPHTSRHL